MAKANMYILVFMSSYLNTTDIIVSYKALYCEKTCEKTRQRDSPGASSSSGTEGAVVPGYTYVCPERTYQPAYGVCQDQEAFFQRRATGRSVSCIASIPYHALCPALTTLHGAVAQNTKLPNRIGSKVIVS